MKHRGFLAAFFVGGVAVLPSACSAADDTLFGRYTYYLADTAAKTDSGPANDEDCRKFLASDLYDSNLAEHLTITANRWDDNQDVSAVTGNVELGESRGDVTPFTIRVESEAADGSGDGITPAKGTLTRLGKLAITINIESEHGRKILHYCRVS
jgi:hypothetical protein